MNRQEWERYITEVYGAEAETPWARYPDNTIFRHSNNRKWFAAVLTVPKEKLGLAADGELDILNVKCDPLLAGALRAERGIFPGYHMNKENWLSVALDGSVEDGKIKLLLDMSFELTSAARRKRKA